MTGHDFTQEETDIFATRLLNGNTKKTFNFPDGAKCQTFARGEWYADPLTKRLHVGRCLGVLDRGKFMWVLVKTNPAHQREAQEYILRVTVLVPGALKELDKCRDTKEGRRLFAQFLKKYLYQRFAKSDIGEFIKAEEFKNFWNIEFLKAYANAYSDLYIGFVEEGQSQLPSADAVVVQRLWDHEDRIGVIINHCDSMFDKTADELKKITKNNKKVVAKMKEELGSLWAVAECQQEQIDSQQEQIDSQQEQVGSLWAVAEAQQEQLDSQQEQLDDVKDEVSDVKVEVSDLKDEVKDLFVSQQQQIDKLQQQLQDAGLGGGKAPASDSL